MPRDGRDKRRPAVEAPEYDYFRVPPTPPRRFSFQLAEEMAEAPRSYCVECDALPGECSHDARRYLDPVRYERVGETSSGVQMWRRPLGERRSS